jgi:putative sterol carrier protein
MSEVIKAAVEALSEKLADVDFAGSIRIDIEDEGSLIVDEAGVRACAADDDTDVDCTMQADADTFAGMLEGDVNPTSAFMSGKLSVDGDMSAAMKLGALLS